MTTIPEASKYPNPITPSWLMRKNSLFRAKKRAAAPVITNDKAKGSIKDLKLEKAESP
jgi:hypothetical protein